MGFLKNTVATFSTQMASIVVGVISSIFIARVLGPSGNGAYSLIMLVPSIMATLGTFGIDVSNLYFVGKRKYPLTNIASNSLTISMAIGIPLFLSFMLYVHYISPGFLRGADYKSLVLASAMVPFSILISFFNMIFLGEQYVFPYNLSNLFQAGARLLLLVLFLFVLRGGVMGAVLAWSGSVIVSLAISLVYVRKITIIRCSFDFPLFRDSMKFGVQAYLGSIVSFLVYRADMLMISYYLGIVAVGYYAVAVYLAESLWYFPSVVGSMILSRTPRAAARDANEFTAMVCRNTLFLVFILSALMSTFGNSIIKLLYGPAFIYALQPLWLLLPGNVVLSINKVLSNELSGRGMPIVGAIAGIISLVLNILINIIVIPKWGINGAAFASTISYCAAAITVLYFFVKVSHNRLIDIIVIKFSDLRIYTAMLYNMNRMTFKGSAK